MKVQSLPSWHYASQWRVDERFTSGEITELGRRYHAETDPSRKEDLLLDLIRRFHPYLVKYMMMISCGRLPENTGKPDSDTHQFLRIYLKPDEPPTIANLGKVCRRLHLAFKGSPAHEIYDVLVALMTEAITRWDPEYSTKVRAVIEAARIQLESEKQEVSLDEINASVGFDALRYCHRLAGYRIFEPVKRPGKKVWKAGVAWPPRPEFMESGTIGLTYVAVRWFRWLLQRYITRKMNELEHANDMMQLGVRRASLGPGVYTDDIIPHSHGNLVNSRTAKKWAADTGMLEKSFDLGQMSLEWIDSCSDPLFRDLSRTERFVLFSVYSLGLSWADVSMSTGLSSDSVKQLHEEMLYKLKTLAGVSE